MASTHKRELFGFLSLNNKKHPLYIGHNIVGRNKKADIVLRDIGTSQQQALITIINNKIYISDLKSSNSTFLGGTALLPLHLYEVEDQCEVIFGTLKATFIINNETQTEDGESLVESQIDDAIFEGETQLQLEDTEHQLTVSEDKQRSVGLTQIFWEARKVFQPNDTQAPYSEAIISKSDSDTDNEIVVIEPTQDLADNLIKKWNNNPLSALSSIKQNEIGKENTNDTTEVNNTLVSEIQSSNASSQIHKKLKEKKFKRKCTKQLLCSDSDTDVEENIVSIQKNNLENIPVNSLQNSPSSQPIRVKRKSTKQVILSDSDTDLDNNDDEVKYHRKLDKSSNDLISENKSPNLKNKLSKKTMGNSENIESFSKLELETRTVKTLGDSPSSLLFEMKINSNKVIVCNSDANLDRHSKTNQELKSQENKKLHSNINDPSVFLKSSPAQIDFNNATDVDENVRSDQEIKDPPELIEEAQKIVEQLDSDNDTDLDDNFTNDEDVPRLNKASDQLQDNTILDMNKLSSQISQIKVILSNLITNSGSDTDDENSSYRKGKYSSGLKITETSNYGMDSDSADSVMFDLNESNLKEELGEYKQKEETLKLKPSIQDASNDIIESTDEEDTETQDNIVLKLYENKNPLQLSKNIYKWTRPSKELGTNLLDIDEKLQNDEETSINESNTKDTTQYITGTRKTLILNETNDNICSESFIPATQDVAENIDVSTTETQKLESQEKVSQASFSLGISDYINHSESENKFTDCKSAEDLNKIVQNNQKSTTPENQISLDDNNDEKSYLVDKKEICGLNIPPADVNRSKDAHEVDNTIFIAPTQKIGDYNDNSNDEIDENSIFAKPTQKIYTDVAASSKRDVDFSSTQGINQDNDYDDAENSIFAKATQKICRNEPNVCSDEGNGSIDDNFLFAKPTQIIHVVEQKDHINENNPSTSKAALLQIKCVSDNLNYSQNSLNPDSSSSFNQITIKQIQSLINNSNDSSKIFQKASNSNAPLSDAVEPPNIAINTTIIDQPIQSPSNIRNDIYDIPTQTEHKSSNQPEKIEIKNADSTLFDMPTQIVIQEHGQAGNNEVERTSFDLFDLPTQIVSNIPDNIVDGVTQTRSVNDSKPVEVLNLEDKIADTGLFEVETQLLVDELPTTSKNGKEINTGQNKDYNKDTVGNDIFHIPYDDTNQKVIKIIPIIKNKDITALQPSGSSGFIEIKSKDAAVDVINDDVGNVDNKITDELISTSRVTRQKSKVASNNKERKKVQKLSKRKNNNKGLSNLEKYKDAEDNTQGTLTSAILTEEKEQFSKKHEEDEVLELKDNITESPQKLMDVATTLLTSTNNENNSELILGKPKDFVKSVDKRVYKGRKMNDRNEKLNQKDDLQEVVKNINEPMSTQDVIDVLTSDPTSAEQEVSKPTFVEPIVFVRPNVKKSSKGKNVKQHNVNLKKANELQLNDGNRTAMYSTQEVIDILTTSKTTEDKEDESKSTFIEPKDVLKPVEVKTAEGKDSEKHSEKNKQHTKMLMFSTQEVINILTSDDGEENQVLPRNKRHISETDVSLSESIFIKGTRQLNANLQSTMIGAIDHDENNQSDDDFEEIKTANEIPCCDNIVGTKNSTNIQNPSTSSKILPNSRKRVTIKDSNLDVMHDILNEDCSTVQKPTAKKHKFPPYVEDDENDMEDSIPPKKTKKMGRSKSESKSRSSKQIPVVGILKKTTKPTRTTRSTNEPTAETLGNVAPIDTVPAKVTMSRPRKTQNNHDVMNKPEEITVVASCSTDDTIKKPILQGKRGRPKKNAAIKIDLKDIAETPPCKKIAGRKDSAASSKYDTISESMSLTPLSQRTKRILKPKVVFTMLNSPELESVIRSLGGTVVDSIEACTVLVTASVKRTEKLLTAIGQGKPICSDKWLKECKIQNKFLDPWCHIFRDAEAETKWDFSLEVSLERSQNRKLFENYTMMLIVNTAQDILKKAIESTGGKCVTTARNLPDNFVIVSVAENQKKFQKYIGGNSDVIVVEPEAIFDAVLRQEIRFEMFKLV